jgi:PAS domain S-box-containing protein
MSPILDASSLSEDHIFDFCPHPMWIYDLDTLRFLKVNNAALQQYGFTKDRFLRMTLKAIRPKKDIAKLEMAIENTKKRKDTYKEGFFRHKKKDGTVFPVFLKGNIIQYKGRPAELVIAMDISDTVEYEKRLLSQNRLFQAISDMNNNLIRNPDWLKALDVCFTLLLETLKIHRVYFFQSDSELDRITLMKIKTDQDPKSDPDGYPALPFPLLQHLIGRLRKGRVFSMNRSKVSEPDLAETLETECLKSLLALPVFSSGTFRGFIGLEDHETERKWTKEEVQLLNTLTTNLSHLINQSDVLDQVKNSESRFKNLVLNGTDLISIVDTDGIYLYASPSFDNQLGYSTHDLMETCFFDRLSKDDIPRLRKALEMVQEVEHVEIEPFRFKHSNGTWKWIESIWSNHLATPHIQGIVMNSRDITERMRSKLKKELWLDLVKAFGKKGSLRDGLDAIMEKLVEVCEIQAAEVWLKSRDGAKFNLLGQASGGKSGELFLKQPMPVDYFSMEKGIQGKIEQANALMIWDDFDQNPEFVRSNFAKKIGLRTCIGLPILSGQESIGCLLLFAKQPKEDLNDILYLVEGIGHQIGGPIKQKMVQAEYLEFFELSPDPFCIIGFDGRIKQANKAFSKAIGKNRTQIVGMAFEAFIHPSDREKLDQVLPNRRGSGRTDGIEMRMLTKSNTEKWFIWSSTANNDHELVLAVAKDITDQKQLEHSLRVSNTRLNRAHRIAKIGYWYRNFDSDLSEWSQETYGIFGYTPENFHPTMENVTKAFHPEDRYLIEENPNIHLEPGVITKFEHRIITGDGAVKWVHQEIQMVVDESSGEPMHIEGTVRDITQEKEYELQLRISSERFLLAMSASKQVIWELDHRSKTLLYCQVLDRVEERITKQPFEIENDWFKRIHPKDRDHVWNTLENHLYESEKKDWAIEYRTISENGSIGYVLDSFYVQRDGRNNPIKTIGSAMDVTEAREQMEKIKGQNKMLTEIAWLQSHAIRSPLTRIMSLLIHHRSYGEEVFSTKDLLDIISTSIDEIDRELHKVIEITNKNFQNDKGNIIDR